MSETKNFYFYCRTIDEQLLLLLIVINQFFHPLRTASQGTKR